MKNVASISLKMRLYLDRTMKSAKYWSKNRYNSQRRRQKRSHINLKTCDTRQTNDTRSISRSLWCLPCRTSYLRSTWWPTLSTRFKSMRRLTSLRCKRISKSDLTTLITKSLKWWSRLESAHQTKTFKSPAASSSLPRKQSQRSSKARTRCHQLHSR